MHYSEDIPGILSIAAKMWQMQVYKFFKQLKVYISNLDIILTALSYSPWTTLFRALATDRKMVTNRLLKVSSRARDRSSHKGHGVPNHWQLECLFKSLFRVTLRKITLRLWAETIGFPMLKILRSRFNMRVPIPGRSSFYIETGPCFIFTIEGPHPL